MPRNNCIRLIYKALLGLFVVFITAINLAYSQRNERLKAELDSIFLVDQQYRTIFSNPRKKDSLAKANNVSSERVDWFIVDKVTTVDRSNSERICEIIKVYGYPGKTLVGVPTNVAAWYVIQHSEDTGRYFPMIRQASAQGELPFTFVATMEDRLLMQQGKKQIYGTQVNCDESGCYVWPIVKSSQVNQRRIRAGFTTTVTENARQLGVNYKIRRLPKKKAN